MKPIKLIKRIRKHKYKDGQTFSIIEDGELDRECYIKYYYDKENDIHGLNLVEHHSTNFGFQESVYESELPSSMLINSNIRYKKMNI